MTIPTLARWVPVAIVLGTHAPAAAQQIDVGPNVHVSRAHADRPHYEIHLAADPDSPHNLVGGAMIWSSATNRYSVAAYTSNDGGRTWVASIEVDLKTYANDPAMGFGPGGVALLSYFGDAERLKTQMFLHRSTDAGRTWQPPARVLLMDRQFITTDNTGGKFHGRVYVHGTRGARRIDGGTSVSGMSVTRSLDGGITFEPQVLLASSGEGYVLGMGSGVVLSDGTFVAVFGERRDREIAQGEPIPEKPNARVKVVSSKDGGETFGSAVAVDDWFMRFGSTTSGSPSIAVDRSKGPFKDRLYVAWPDYRAGRADIQLAFSADSGKTWSRSRVINDDRGALTSARGRDHFMPVVAVNRDGIVGIMWYDRRDSPDNLGWWPRFSASLDGGDTWLPSVKLSPEPFDYAREKGLVILGRAVTETPSDVISVRAAVHHFNNKGGDTAGLVAAADGRFHPFWVDNRTGIPQIWTAPVSVSGRVAAHGDPTLAGSVDVTSKVALDLSNVRYDPAGKRVTMDARLRNTSKETLAGPFHARVVALGSVFGLPEAERTDNGVRGPGAIWRFKTPEGSLPPEGSTDTRRLEFVVTGMTSLRPPEGTPSVSGGHDIVRLDLRVIGRVISKDSDQPPK